MILTQKIIIHSTKEEKPQENTSGSNLTNQIYKVFQYSIVIIIIFYLTFVTDYFIKLIANLNISFKYFSIIYSLVGRYIIPFILMCIILLFFIIIEPFFFSNQLKKTEKFIDILIYILLILSAFVTTLNIFYKTNVILSSNKPIGLIFALILVFLFVVLFTKNTIKNYFYLDMIFLIFFYNIVIVIYNILIYSLRHKKIAINKKKYYFLINYCIILIFASLYLIFKKNQEIFLRLKKNWKNWQLIFLTFIATFVNLLITYFLLPKAFLNNCISIFYFFLLVAIIQFINYIIYFFIII